MLTKLSAMFTGIVQTTGRIKALDRNDFGLRLVVERGGLDAHVRKGDSICVSGVCLTAVAFDGDTLGFDVIAETLDKTTLGRRAVGDPVNLEPAVTPQQPLGGHFMQGHVDGVGQVVRVLGNPAQWRVTIRPPAELMRYIIPKGSVAVDGVSLTVASVNPDDTFDVALIPETLSRTTLGNTGPDAAVNLEADVLSKTVVHWLERTNMGRPAPKAQDEPVTMTLLRDAGFAN